MKICNYGSDLNNKITLRLTDDQKRFLNEKAKSYNITESQFLRILIDWHIVNDPVRKDKT